ncbi:MAG: hypothetical protein SFY95_02555, partial [Planctomycetota bacterium]|nr:hypothetical protein [Planctomycetota bacterium]
MQRSIAVLSLCAGLAVSGMTRAQSFNIEVNNGAITAVSNSFGAAGLPGAWNSYNSSSPATIPLVNLDGSASGVTFTRSLVANYATAATANISDFKAVLDDYQFVTGVSQMSMTFNNLQPGVYMVIVYNGAPSAANVANYWSPEQTSPTWNYGGGTVGANTFKPLRTHNYMVCQTNGSNAINVKVQAAAGEARVSAIQIVKLTTDWRVYVNTPTRGSQAGTSWLSAMGDLQDALNIARVLEDRCEIWVGSGTYKPTAGTDRTLAFDVAPGVSIYGGFAGTETSIGQRSGLPADETILSGAIGTAAATDNSRTVVKVNFAGTRAVTLDGLTIRDG